MQPSEQIDQQSNLSVAQPLQQQPAVDGAPDLQNGYDPQAHVGHESLHTFLFFLLILIVVAAQVGLHKWKEKKPNSFLRATFIGLWLMPPLFFPFIVFRLLWFLYTCYTGYLIYLSFQKPLAKTTPRKIYSWFLNLYNLSYSVAVLGYCLILLDIFNIIHLLGISYHTSVLGLLLSLLGMYFGVLDRDCAEVCTDKMSSTLGFTDKSGLPSRKVLHSVCSICSNPLHSKHEVKPEPTFTLPCGHVYHETCIRGWAIVGKKDSCPYCKEKVRIKDILPSNPWTKQTLFWSTMLDALRYLIVWNPVIFGVVQVLFFILDR